jgi:DNA topoisomerase IB
VEDTEVLTRINALAIPPAWDDVWVCPYPMGHIQATGTDARGRKQYRYHDKWRERRDQQKFDEMVEFARVLPAVRRRVTEDLSTEGVTRERVLACAVRLLDRGFFRVGGEDYAVENESYGLATIHKRHVKLLKGDVLVFDYPAKSGKRRYQAIVDPEVYEIVAALKRRRGGSTELLAYRDGRRWRDIKSADINAYVKEITGGDYSAKDFRTWNATVLAARALAISGEMAGGSRAARKRAINHAIKEVARYLGNTPAVCRASYIDPRIFDRYEGGLTIGGAIHLGEAGDAVGANGLHGEEEAAVLDLIAEDEDSPALEKVA